MRRIFLVTGGAGFIGSHIVEALLAGTTDSTVRVFDNFSSGNARNLASGSLFLGRLEVIEGDICDLVALSEAFRGADVVFHQAALVSVPKSVDDPLFANHQNVTGTINVLEAARRNGVRRVVYASSSAVYGDVPGERKFEDDTPAPISPYGVAKVICEQYAAAWTSLYGVETVGLRYFNVLGPRQDPASQYAAVVPRFITAALRGMPLEIHGDGLQSRDFIYVENVARANLAAANAASAAGKVFNVGHGVPTTLLELVTLLENVLGHPLRRSHTMPRVADIRRIYADIATARQVLGDFSVVGLREGLERTIRYLSSHDNTALPRAVQP